MEEGAKHQEATKDGPLDPKEEGISWSEKIRRRQNQPIPMSFPKTDVQLGKTKVFMRKHPHDCLEAHRVFHQHASATVIQCWARGLAEQRKYFITQDAVLTIQRCYRGSKGRERYVMSSGRESSVVCRASATSGIILHAFLLCFTIAGGAFARLWLEIFLPRCFGCLFIGESSTAQRKERFSTRLLCVDAIPDAALLPQQLSSTIVATMPGNALFSSSRPFWLCSAVTASRRQPRSSTS